MAPQGLRYNHDKNYHRCHHCQPKQFLLILVKDQYDTLGLAQPSSAAIDDTLTDNSNVNIVITIHFQLSDDTLQGKSSHNSEVHGFKSSIFYGSSYKYLVFP